MTFTPLAASTSSALAKGRLGERMRIDPQKKRTVDAFLLAIYTNRLRDREDMPFVEGSEQGRAAVARGPKRDSLLGNMRVRALGEILRDQARYIDEIRRLGWLTGQRT